MKNRKRIINVVIVLMILVFYNVCCINSVFSETIPEQTNDFYVNDFANLFSIEQKEEMMKNAIELSKEGVQVVVTTVKTLGNFSVEDYATEMYNKYRIGREDKGILILLSTQERKIRVEVGYGLEDVITASKAGKYIDDYALDYLRSNQFDKGLVNLQKAIVEDLNMYFEFQKSLDNSSSNAIEILTPVLTLTEYPVRSDEVTNEEQSIYGILGLFLIVILIICIFIQKYKYKKWKAGSLREYNRLLESKNNESQALIKRFEDGIQESDIKINDLRNKVNELSRELTNVTMENSKISAELNDILAKYNRALNLYPDLEQEITEMIQRETDEQNRLVAANFDKNYEDLLSEEYYSKCVSEGMSGYCIVETALRVAINAYEALNPEQKKFSCFNSDIAKEKLNYFTKLIAQEKAKEFNEKLDKRLKVLKGNEASLVELNSLFVEYREYDCQTRDLISTSLLSMLNAMITEANLKKRARIEKEKAEIKKRKEQEEAEKRRRREEERRRRRMHEEEKQRLYNSSHSSSGNSSFGGFGGSSGGSGSSRSF